jgi:hypothetical protein
MTLKDFRDKIKRLPKEKREELNKLEVIIDYPYLNINETLQGFVDIYRFVQKQYKGWEKLPKTSSYLEDSKKHFTEIYDNLDKYITNGFKEIEISWRTESNYLNNALSALRKSKIEHRNNVLAIFTYDASETDFLVSLFKKFPNSVYAAAMFLSEGVISMTIGLGKYYDTKEVQLNFDNFIGMQQAYEFRLQDNERVRRSELEKKSLEELRDSFNDYLEKAEDTLQELIQKNSASLKIAADEIETITAKKVKEFTNQQEHNNTNYQNWFGNTQKEYLKWFQETNSNHKNWSSDTDKKYSEWFSSTGQTFTKWFAQTKKSFSEFDKKSQQTIAEKEKLYTEKLKLEAPATYWRQRALKLRKEGDRWLYWLIAIVVIAVGLLGMVLYFISDGTLKELFDKTGSAVRWSIVFITFVSFLAYAIRTFAKLMFSAYHLVRDAEEREQLAYVYLALKKEQNIDDTERHLIMQSIFSRVDSGLLKSEASPTMPGGSIVDKIFPNKS